MTPRPLTRAIVKAGIPDGTPALGRLSRRGRLEGMESESTTQTIKAFVPLAEMFGYANTLRSRTQGRASYSMEPSHFEPVPQNIVEQIVEQRGTK